MKYDPYTPTTIIESNGSKWNGQDPDRIETLILALKEYSLDPVFERFGNFFSPVGSSRHPYYGTFHFFGNFKNLSHVFSIYTNEIAVIQRLLAGIRNNQETAEYKAARRIA